MNERTPTIRRLCLVTLLTVVLMNACGPSHQTTRNEANVTTTMTVEGVARQAKVGPLIELDDGSTMWVDLDAWPDEVLGARVIVSGVMSTRHDLPVFVHKKGEPIRSGMPVPEGADLKKASQRQVLSKIQFKLVEESKP